MSAVYHDQNDLIMGHKRVGQRLEEKRDWDKSIQNWSKGKDVLTFQGLTEPFKEKPK